MAEYCHKRLVDRIDMEATVINCMTGNAPSGAAIPVHFATDSECLEKALQTVGFVEPENAKVLRVRDTLHLGELLVSESYEKEFASRDDLSILAPATAMEFDTQGDLLEW
jgi:hypothetical protein